MRIGIFSDTYPPFINGVSTSSYMLKISLEKLGHQVYIVTVNSENANYKFEDNDRIIRLPSIPIKLYDYRLSGFYSIKAINKIKKWNLDIIHSQTEFGIGIFARLLAKQFDIPLVHTYHTMYEDYVQYITKGYFDKSAKKIVQYLTNFYCDKTPSELVVPTKKTYDLFKQKYKYTRDIHIIPTGIEIDRFFKEKQKPKELNELREKLGLKVTDFVIIFIGRLGYEKNIDFLIDCQHELTKKYSNCKLIIVGSGPDEKKFLDQTKKLKIENSVIFTGKVPWEQVPNYYNISNVFTSASLTETQGLTIIEALASSLPVIAIDDECFTNVITNGHNGYIFKKKSDYKKIMTHLIENPIELEKLSRQSRISSENYSTKQFGQSIIKVYESAIAKNPKESNFLKKIRNIVKRGLNE